MADTTPPEPSDGTLLADLARGRQEAMGPLYSRYAPLVFGIARQSLDRGIAEDIVQDVFLAVWKNARSYDPGRGPVRPWLLQIAHFRIANELRRRSRRPALAGGSGEEALAAAPEPGADAAEKMWLDYRGEVLRSALASLPPRQRQALGLSFFDELSHPEIATLLDLPLGTAKSRIRAGIERLRSRVGAVSAAALVLVVGIWIATRAHSDRSELARDDRALGMLTSSDAEAIRLERVSGTIPVDAHGTWRARRGSPIAVVTLSHFPAAPTGRVYRVWARWDGRWLLAGSARPDADGRARIVAEDSLFGARPATIEVTLEDDGPAGESPAGPPLVAWESPPQKSPRP